MITYNFRISKKVFISDYDYYKADRSEFPRIVLQENNLKYVVVEGVPGGVLARLEA